MGNPITSRPGYDGPIEEHLGLVGWVPAKRMPSHVFERLERDDLYQAGVIGLLNAKRLFDPARGLTFSTFAVAKIRWSMLIAAGLTRKGWEPRPQRLPERFGEVNV